MNKETKDPLIKINQEHICEMCEICILGCKRSTSTFQCEGSRCEEAIEMFLEDYEPEEKTEDDEA